MRELFNYRNCGKSTLNIQDLGKHLICACVWLKSRDVKAMVICLNVSIYKNFPVFVCACWCVCVFVCNNNNVDFNCVCVCVSLEPEITMKN